METPQQSSNARLAAILALIAVFIVLMVVIATSLGGGGSGKHSNRSGGGSQNTANSQKQSSQKIYVVRPGDCCLSQIAGRVGLSVDALEKLNPGLDPQTIHSGDRVKLR
jgi:LysM repeat protein